MVAAAGQALPDAAALRAHVAGSLPDYMVPSGYVVLDRLPLTPNGKLDRRALPAPVRVGALSGGSARTPQEEILCGLFGRFWGFRRVGIWDNFFELGGDSIISIQLVSRARQAGLVITPRAVFQHQTVEALAAVAAPAEGRQRLLPISRPVHCRSPRSCIGCWSAAGRSSASSKRAAAGSGGSA